MWFTRQLSIGLPTAEAFVMAATANTTSSRVSAQKASNFDAIAAAAGPPPMFTFPARKACTASCSLRFTRPNK
jgi:hypothetical protein